MTNKRVRDEYERVTGALGGISEIAGAIKWVAILAVVLVVLWTALQIIPGAMAVFNFVGNTATAVKEVGIEGVATAIEGTGEAAAVVRDAAGNAVSTATEGVDFQGIGETADTAVDNSIGWLGEKANALRDAVTADDATTVDAE